MSSNIALDKFYTPSNIATSCIALIKETLADRLEITEWLEPSAGAGAFSNLINGCVAYDIAPEADNIEQADFLNLSINYKQGRLIFGNPPFGDRNNLFKQFFKKAIKIADAVAFIIPISQLNNTDSLYEFDLIKSIDLGKVPYSGVSVHCCFNIYLRPANGLNKKVKITSPLFNLVRTDQKDFQSTQEDFKIIKRGNAGTLVPSGSTFGDEYKVVVHDKTMVDYVKDTITNFNWKTYKHHLSAPNISKNDIYRLFN